LSTIAAAAAAVSSAGVAMAARLRVRRVVRCGNVAVAAATSASLNVTLTPSPDTLYTMSFVPSYSNNHTHTHLGFDSYLGSTAPLITLFSLRMLRCDLRRDACRSKRKKVTKKKKSNNQQTIKVLLMREPAVRFFGCSGAGLLVGVFDTELGVAVALAASILA
jgi:hypothetical protein